MVRTRNPETLARDSHLAHDPAAEVDSLRRGLELLRLFDARHRSLQVSEIASKLGLSRVTAAKLVSTLVSQNFLRAAGQEGAFEPHVACLALGRSVKRGLPVVQAAQPRMLALSQRFEVHVTLSTRDRAQMLVVEHVVPAGQVRLGLDTGARLPMASSASGRAYLWAQPKPQRGKWLEIVSNDDGEGARRKSELKAAFQELDEKGWCFMAAPVTSQTSSIATPIYAGNEVDYVLTAMAVGPAVERKLRDKVAPELLAQARMISHDLGAHPPEGR
jgi:DNA-binding IclR family transcriptional regulator